MISWLAVIMASSAAVWLLLDSVREGRFQRVLVTTLTGLAAVLSATFEMLGQAVREALYILGEWMGMLRGAAGSMAHASLRARRRARLPVTVSMTLLLVPDGKRQTLRDDLLNDRLDGAKWSAVNGLRAAARIGVSARWAQLLDALNVPRHASWWQDCTERGVQVRLAAATALGVILTNMVGILDGGPQPVGIVPTAIWYCSILRSELVAARRIAGDDDDHLRGRR